MQQPLRPIFQQKTSPTSSYSFFPLLCSMDNLEGKHKHEYSNDAYLSNFLWDSIKPLKPVNENRANMRWGTTDEQLLHHSQRKKPTRRGENKPQTAILISMHVLRFAQLHSDWSLHNKPVRMKQNCSRKVRETSLLPPLKKEKTEI